MRPVPRDRDLGTLLAGTGPLVAALLLLSAAPAVQAQQARPARPGDVVTFSLRVPAPEGTAAGRADVRVDEVAGARLFGAPERSVEVDGGAALVPLTFQLGDDLGAGTRRIARLRVAWPGGRRDTVPVEVEVPVRRRMEGGFTAPSARVTPGGEAEVRYAVRNRGNAPDTVRLSVVEPATGWRLAPRRDRVTLAPGGADTVRVSVHAPGRASLGSIQRLRLAARGSGAESVDALTLRVVESGGWMPGVEHVPGRVFLGSTTSGAPGSTGGVVAAVEAGGTVGAGTEVLLEGRYRPEGLPTPRPLHEDVLGPVARLQVRNPEWRAGVGDVFARSDPLAGSFLAGRGADVSWDTGDAFGEVFAAVPQGASARGHEGHAVLASGGLALDGARVGLVASDVRRSSGLALSSGRTQSLGGRLRMGDRSGRFVSLEAGVLRLSREAGGAVTGPAAEGELWLSGEEGMLNVRGRVVPGELPGGPTLSDRVFAGGRYRIGSTLDAVGRASVTSSDPGPAGPGADFRQAEAGVRYAPRGLRLEGVFRVRDSDGVFGDAARRTRYTGVLSANVPAGPLHLDGRLEVGREASGVGGSAFHRLRASARWTGGRGWGRLTAGQERSAGVGSRAFAEAEGGIELDGVAVSGGASAESGVFGSARVEGWTRVSHRLPGDLRVVAGVERREFGFGGGEWGVSMGVEKALDLPLPLPDRPLSHGVVFLDRNGNGRRDPGERGLPGVTVRKGFVDVTTDARGQFRIRQEAVRGRAVEVDATTLPAGALVPPGVEIPRAGGVEIPVIRTASLEVTVFADGDEDGRRDRGEPFVEGAVVTLDDATGRSRVAETDASGRVRLGALRPGRCTVRVRVPGDGRRRPVEEQLELELDAGAVETRGVAVVTDTRPVRYGDSGRPAAAEKGGSR